MAINSYLEMATLRFSEFGGFAPVPEERLSPALAEWGGLVLERVEKGLTTLVVLVPLLPGPFAAALQAEMTAMLTAEAAERHAEHLGLLMLVTEGPITREEYQRLQALVFASGRVRLVPWVIDLARQRLLPHQGPPFGLDPDLYVLAEPDPAQCDELLRAHPGSDDPAGGDAQRPWVTIGLVAILVLIWVVMTVAGGSLDATESSALLHQWGAASRPTLILKQQSWRLFTANFLHIGFVHLASNVLSLWWVGQMVEMLYGGWRTLYIYLIAGVAGAVASLAFGQPMVLAAGASGAIMGLLGAVVWFWLRSPQRNRLRFTPILVVLVVNLAAGLVLHEFVDNWGHLGGLVGGFAAALAIGLPPQQRPEPSKRWLRPLLHGAAALLLTLGAVGTVTGQIEPPGPSQRLAQAVAAYEAGQMGKAEGGFKEAVRRQPDEPTLRLLLAWTYFYQEKYPEAEAELNQAMALDPSLPSGLRLREALRPHLSR